MKTARRPRWVLDLHEDEKKSEHYVGAAEPHRGQDSGGPEPDLAATRSARVPADGECGPAPQHVPFARRRIPSD